MKSVGSRGIFYATALKALKGKHRVSVILFHLRVTSLFEFPPMKSNDRIALEIFHQKMKITMTWLKLQCETNSTM